MKNNKSIAVKISLEGKGTVNFDSGDLGFAVNRSINSSVKSRFDNVNYAKSYFKQGVFEGKEGMIRGLRISADCLRHGIHIEGHPFHTPNVANNDLTKVHYLASPDTFLRGYLIANTGERRKSCYSITSAHEVSGAQVTLEMLSRSGAKEQGKEGGAGDTTLFARDSVGDTRYEAEMFIDISELSMISLSDLADRRAIMDDLVPAYRQALSENLGSPVGDPAYYIKKGSAYLIPEKGILLNQEQIKSLVITLLKKVAQVNITKSQTGFAKVTDIQIKGISDPLKDSGDEGFVKIFSKGKFDEASLSQAVESFDLAYTPMGFAEAESLLSTIEEGIAKAKKAAGDKKKADKEKKKATTNSTTEEPSKEDE